MTVSPAALLPSTVMSDWTFAQGFSSRPVMDNANTTSTNNSTQTIGDTTSNQTFTTTVADSYTSTGSMMDVMTGGTWSWSVDNHTIITITSTASSTGDPASASNDVSTSDRELTETMTSGPDGTTTTFNQVTTNTDTSSSSATPSDPSIPSETHSRYLKETLTQTGSIDNSGTRTGTYTLVASGKDKDTSSTMSALSGTETSTANSSNSRDYTLNASGGLLGTSTPTTYSMSFSGKTSDDMSDANKTGDPAGYGANATYNESNSISLTAAGTGFGDPTEAYMLTAGGKQTLHTDQTSGGSDSSGDFTVLIKTTNDATISYNLSDGGGGSATYTQNGTNASSMNATITDATGSLPLNVTASDTFSVTAAPGTGVVTTGTPFILAGLTLPPPPPVPARVFIPPLETVGPDGEELFKNYYYNWLAAQWNAGTIGWPFAGSPPLKPPAGELAYPSPIVLLTPTLHMQSGGVNLSSYGLPYFWSGVILRPYDRPFPGGVWVDYYWWGYRVSYDSFST